jgi:hypothetical protein
MDDSLEERITNPYERSILAAIAFAGRRGYKTGILPGNWVNLPKSFCEK